MPRLTSLTLTNFRNHGALRIKTAGQGRVLLLGANGVGKTNVLEAISLLAPGRGLRHLSRFDEVLTQGAPATESWGVVGDFVAGDQRHFRLATGAVPAQAAARRLRIDQRPVKNQAEILNYWKLLWLTPDMDRVLGDGASVRRRLFDQWISVLVPDHAYRLARYEKNMRERLRLLTSGSAADGAWLDVLEEPMAADAVAIMTARHEAVARIMAHVASVLAQGAPFLPPRVDINSDLDRRVLESPARDVESFLRACWQRERARDAASGRTTTGAHRSQITVLNANTQQPASLSSSGEQKALLISLILGVAETLRQAQLAPPTLLLDDVAAHLDPSRRAALFDLLRAMDIPAWLTGSDVSDFTALETTAQVVLLPAARTASLQAVTA